jgi:hypothetical protein
MGVCFLNFRPRDASYHLPVVSQATVVVTPLTCVDFLKTSNGLGYINIKASAFRQPCCTSPSLERSQTIKDTIVFEALWAQGVQLVYAQL